MGHAGYLGLKELTLQSLRFYLFYLVCSCCQVNVWCVLVVKSMFGVFLLMFGVFLLSSQCLEFLVVKSMFCVFLLSSQCFVCSCCQVNVWCVLVLCLFYFTCLVPEDLRDVLFVCLHCIFSFYFKLYYLQYFRRTIHQ